MLNVTMTYKKSTKGTHVYEDKSADAAIPTLYIKKGHLNDPVPDSIEVTIKSWEDGADG